MTMPPANLNFIAEHQWVSPGQPAAIGVTEHAQAALGDIVYLFIPSVGDEVVAGKPCGEIESAKTVSDIYSPVTGYVAEVNPAVQQRLALINEDPYGEGWLFKVEVSGFGDLLSAEEYRALVAV